VVIAMGVFGSMPLASAQQPLAPPLRGGGINASYGTTNLFDWHETPRDQRVEIIRATFDSYGYQLTDTNGQIISVPFTDSNLYVMQFGRTNNGMYFVNDGDRTPILYLSADSFLENASVGGARWYPFPQRYYYTAPVYLGPAPSWNSYCTMGWYPSMVVYGGYYTRSAWRIGSVCEPISGWSISIGNRPCNNWDDFSYYCRTTPVQRVVFIDQPRRDWRDSRDLRSARPTYRYESRDRYESSNNRYEPSNNRRDGRDDRYSSPRETHSERPASNYDRPNYKYDDRDRSSAPVYDRGAPTYDRGAPSRDSRQSTDRRDSSASRDSRSDGGQRTSPPSSPGRSESSSPQRSGSSDSRSGRDRESRSQRGRG
jgi:hypothetical protein